MYAVDQSSKEDGDEENTGKLIAEAAMVILNLGHRIGAFRKYGGNTIKEQWLAACVACTNTMPDGELPSGAMADLSC